MTLSRGDELLHSWQIYSLLGDDAQFLKHG